MYAFYESPVTLEEALLRKAHHGAAARIVAGATDLLLEIERGARKAPGGGPLGLIDLSRIPGLATIEERDGRLILGPLVTHNQCIAHPAVVARAFPLARACWEVGAPQIRNRATVAGNIITASPSNDTIAPLLALDADVTVQSAARGPRTLPLTEFITGFRKVDLAEDEILTAVSFRTLGPDEAGAFVKLGLRRAQAITVVNAAVIIGRKGERVAHARIALGAVAPTVMRAVEAERSLHDHTLDDGSISAAARLAASAASPIGDIRATADYRRAMIEVLVARLLRQIAAGQERAGWSERPVLLWGDSGGIWPAAGRANAAGPALVNGHAVELPGGMTLLDSLRAAGLTSVKEGCAEGECGACTVFLDGMAIMACMVPAERAAGSEVVTLEGLAQRDKLHPVQDAFVQSGGVQCGFCTPGFIMSAAKLLEERPQPTYSDAQEAFTGNFCRCTGYRKILDAAVLAGKLAAKENE